MQAMPVEHDWSSAALVKRRKQVRILSLAQGVRGRTPGEVPAPFHVASAQAHAACTASAQS